jgi:hypothetical protein
MGNSPKTVLSGAAPGHIREQTEGLAPAQLRELAVQLAADPDLTVSVISYDDGRQELEVLHTGPPHRTEHTIDCCRFEREPAATAARTLSVSTPAALLDAADGNRMPADQKTDGAPSVLYDAVIVITTKNSATTLAAMPTARDFVTDAYAHCRGQGPEWFGPYSRARAGSWPAGRNPARAQAALRSA